MAVVVAATVIVLVVARIVKNYSALVKAAVARAAIVKAAIARVPWCNCSCILCSRSSKSTSRTKLQQQE
jgi:hypothetical protein